jgi:hypothetical protein
MGCLPKDLAFTDGFQRKSRLAALRRRVRGPQRYAVYDQRRRKIERASGQGLFSQGLFTDRKRT